MKVLYTLLILLIPFVGFGQDVLIKKDGFRMDVVVKEIDKYFIKYVKWENKTGPIYKLDKSKIFKVVYSNGSEEQFINNINLTNKTKTFLNNINLTIGVIQSNINSNIDLTNSRSKIKYVNNFDIGLSFKILESSFIESSIASNYFSKGMDIENFNNSEIFQEESNYISFALKNKFVFVELKNFKTYIMLSPKVDFLIKTSSNIVDSNLNNLLLGKYSNNVFGTNYGLGCAFKMKNTFVGIELRKALELNYFSETYYSEIYKQDFFVLSLTIGFNFEL
jgi:hypothetical protein